MIILLLLIVMAIALCLIARRVKPPLDPTKHRKAGLLIMPVKRQQSEREQRELEAKRREKEREEAKWDRLRSETLRESPKELLYRLNFGDRRVPIFDRDGRKYLMDMSGLFGRTTQTCQHIQNFWCIVVNIESIQDTRSRQVHSITQSRCICGTKPKPRRRCS